MRTSVINRFAKNDRAFSVRRRVAVLAATTVLAGGVQLHAMSDTAWACGSSTGTTFPAPTIPSSAHHGSFSAGFHMTPGGQTITPGGAKVEVGVGVGNFTGAPYENVSAMLSLYNPASSHPEEGVDLRTANLRPEDFTVEVMSGGVWKPVALRHSCDPTLFTVASPATTATRLEDGRAANFMFRVGLSAKAPKDLAEIQIGVGAQAPGFPGVAGDTHTYRVERAAPTKPAPTKPAPTTSKAAKPAPAEPAADRTPAGNAQAAEAPVATPSAAPATTAPAGTPELAHTGAAETDTFLATSSAALLALGTGVLLAVRRLRRQR
ncbi:hypothetical protein [Kitasatospora sp. NPDC017646]|uniref:hypothetical protein n=1 Tax=Kitasatospora sp. NPDC017646 TaxID=3364024 RepID=UPI0037B03AA2